MRCPKCNALNEEGAGVCSSCSAALGPKRGLFVLGAGAVGVLLVGLVMAGWGAQNRIQEARKARLRADSARSAALAAQKEARIQAKRARRWLDQARVQKSQARRAVVEAKALGKRAKLAASKAKAQQQRALKQTRRAEAQRARALKELSQLRAQHRRAIASHRSYTQRILEAVREAKVQRRRVLARVRLEATRAQQALAQAIARKRRIAQDMAQAIAHKRRIARDMAQTLAKKARAQAQRRRVLKEAALARARARGFLKASHQAQKLIAQARRQKRLAEKARATAAKERRLLQRTRHQGVALKKLYSQATYQGLQTFASFYIRALFHSAPRLQQFGITGLLTLLKHRPEVAYSSLLYPALRPMVLLLGAGQTTPELRCDAALVLLKMAGNLPRLGASFHPPSSQRRPGKSSLSAAADGGMWSSQLSKPLQSLSRSKHPCVARRVGLTLAFSGLPLATAPTAKDLAAEAPATLAALMKLVTVDSASFPIALTLLADPRPGVVRLAFGAIAALGPKAISRGFLVLVSRLADPRVGWRAARLLLRKGVTAQPKALARLLALLRHSSSQVRSRAARVIGVMGPRAIAKARTPLLQELQTHPAQGAVEALGKMDAQGIAPVLKEFMALARHKKPGVRRRATAVMKGWSPKAVSPLLPAILPYLKSDRSSALLLLYKCGAKALPVLLSQLRARGSYWERLAIESAIKRINPVSPKILPRILPWLKDKGHDALHQRIAASLLVKVGLQAHLPLVLKKHYGGARLAALGVIARWPTGRIESYMPQLLPLLKTHHWTQLAAMKAMERLPSGVLSKHWLAFVPLLKKHRRLRRMAARILAKALSKETPEARVKHLPSLLPLLRHKGARLTVAKLLRAMVPRLPPEALRALLPLLAKPTSKKLEADFALKDQLLAIFAGQGPKAAALAIPILLTQLRKSSYWRRLYAMGKLGELGPQAVDQVLKHVAPLLAKWKGRRPIYWPWHGLRRWGPKALVRASPMLLSAIAHHKDPWIQKTAVSLVQRLGPKALDGVLPLLLPRLQTQAARLAALLGNLSPQALGKTLPRLGVLLQHKNPKIRLSLARALPRLGGWGRAHLRALLKDPHLEVKLAAARGLKGPPSLLLPQLLPLLARHRRARVAMSILALVPKAAPQVSSAVAAWLRHPYVIVRGEAVSVFRKLGLQTLPQVLQILKEPKGPKDKAIELLEFWGPKALPDGLVPLLGLLRHPRRETRMRALAALAAMGPRGYPRWLPTYHREGLFFDWRAARNFAKRGALKALPLLMPMLKSTHQSVGHRAFTALLATPGHVLLRALARMFFVPASIFSRDRVIHRLNSHLRRHGLALADLSRLEPVLFLRGVRGRDARAASFRAFSRAARKDVQWALRGLSFPHPRYRAAAREALLRPGRSSGLLLALKGSSTPWLRGQAAYFLGLRCEAKAIPLLQKTLRRTQHEQLQMHIAFALARLRRLHNDALAGAAPKLQQLATQAVPLDKSCPPQP